MSKQWEMPGKTSAHKKQVDSNIKTDAAHHCMVIILLLPRPGSQIVFPFLI
jgi:hypothetical protein